MGHPVDEPLSAWGECLLPEKLAEHLHHVTVAGTPLVLDEQQMSKTTRPPMPAESPSRIPGYLVAGLLIGGAFAGLARLASSSPSSPLSPSPGTPVEGR